jgi:hypothetical protein
MLELGSRCSIARGGDAIPVQSESGAPMKVFTVVIALLIAMWVSMLVGIVWYESKHPCLRYEDKLVHHDEFTTMEPRTGINLSTGDPVMTLTPVYHPAYDAMEHACVSKK